MDLNVQKIQFINREYCTLMPKEFVYLHCLSYRNKYPDADWKYIAEKEPFNEDTTTETVTSEFVKSVNDTVEVSRRCKLLTFVKDWQATYGEHLEGIEVYPNFTVEVVNISNATTPLPDLSVVWEINRIAPQMCGMLFENIISHCLGISDDVSDLTESLCEFSENVTSLVIEGILCRNFISREYLVRGDKIDIGDVIKIGSERLTEKHFVSKWHYLMFVSLKHFMKRGLDGSAVEDCLNVLDYIKTHIEDMEKYYYQMNATTLLRVMRKEKFEHGLMFRRADLHGEIDFISDETILDIKCYRSAAGSGCQGDWFGQLWLYEQLAGERKKKWIVNVYSNKLYKFTKA